MSTFSVDYMKVGEIDAESIFEAYMATQNIGDSWTQRNDPTTTPLNVGKYCPHRSTGVGDILEFNGKKYIVVSDATFVEIEKE
jgi:hypothetical protein